MRYKKKGAGMPKGAGNGMYMNGGRMYSTGGAVPGGTATPTVGVAFYKQNVPEVELAGAAGNPEAAKVHEFSYTAIPGVFTSNQTPAGQKVFYDESGKQFTPEALRAHAEKNTLRSTPTNVAFPRGAGHESSPDFNSMEAAVLMTDYEKELATRSHQREDAKRAGTFNPNADYNKIPIPAGYSTSSGQIAGRRDPTDGGNYPWQGYNAQPAAYGARGKNKQGQTVNAGSLSDPNQPTYYAGQSGEISPTQMVLDTLGKSGGRYKRDMTRQMEKATPDRLNRINQKKRQQAQRKAQGQTQGQKYKN
jgi:hypothetical protein